MSLSSPQVMTASVQLAGGLSCILSVHRLGKRFLSLLSMSLCTILILCIAVYTLYMKDIDEPRIPLVLFGLMYYSLNLGVSPIPWMLVSEVFPQRLVHNYRIIVRNTKETQRNNYMSKYQN